MNRLTRALAIAGAAIVLLTSCVSVDTAITVTPAGSGTVSLTYTVSRMVAELGRVDPTWQGIPLPIEQADFQRAVSQVSGLSLTSFNRTEDDKNITIKAGLTFTSLTALNGLYSPGGQAVTLATANGKTTYTQELFEGFPDGVDAQSRQFATDFFSDYGLKFSFTAPKPIQSTNLGTISADKKSVSYSIAIPKLLEQTTPLVLRLTW